MSRGRACGTIGYAAVISWRVHGELPYSPRPALTAAALALPFVPLVLLRGSWAVNTVLLAVTVVGYVGLLLWRRVITVDEIAALRRVVRRDTGGVSLRRDGVRGCGSIPSRNSTRVAASRPPDLLIGPDPELAATSAVS